MGVIGDRPLALGTFCEWVNRTRPLFWSPSARRRAHRSWALLRDLLQRGQPIYGLSTGFGQEGERPLRPVGQRRVHRELLRYHRCGGGPWLGEREGRAVLLARLLTLARGYSGVRPTVVDWLARAYQAGLAPMLPSRGSVGASGDLTPLCYLAHFVEGRGRTWYAGRRWLTREALAVAGLKPLRLRGREVLALMNGTSVMTALAALAHGELESWVDRAAVVSGWGAAGLGLAPEWFDRRPLDLKGHPGAVRAAAAMGVGEAGLGPTDLLGCGRNIQPRYSFRCAPLALGALADTLGWTRIWLERELNGLDDNPLVDPELARVWHTGNFSGFHVALACDALRQALAMAVSLLDRQAQLLLDPSANGGLGPNLEIWDPERPRFGLKAVGIALSALAAEVRHLAAPASTLSSPTESGNQDVVSHGTLSALLLGRSVRLSWRALAHAAWVAAVALRRRGVEEGRDALARKVWPLLVKSRRLDGTLAQLISVLRNNEE